MTIPRLLLLGSVISLWVAAAGAQTLPPSDQDSSQPAPVLSQNAEAGIQFFPLFEDLQSYWQSSSQSTPDSIKGEDDSGKMPAPVQTRRILTMEQNDVTCLTLRTYRVARVTPESDTTRFAGYSTCQPTSRFQLKTAVDSKAIEPR